MFLLILPGFASAEESPLPRLDDAAPDQQGMIWALGRNERGQLHSFDGKQWKVVPAPFKTDDEAQPLRLTPLPDGAVACLWKLSKDRLAITRHLQGETGVIAAAFPGKLQQLGGIYPHLFEDSHRQFWISGSGPEIHRLGADGRVTLAYVIQPDQLLKATQGGHSYNPLPPVGMHADGRMVTFPKTPEAPPSLHSRAPGESYNSVFTAEDGNGRIWAWSNTRGTNYCSLEGVLVFDGEKVDQHRQVGGIDGTLFSVIVKKDEKHMWVAVHQQGLFEVDIDTFEAKPAGPNPSLLPFGGIQMIFAEGEDWYVITTGLRLKGELWRLRAGKWTEIIPKLDESYRDADATERARLHTDKGLILRSCGAAPWFISGTAVPAHVDWQSGFTVADARRIFRMKDESLFALGAKGEVFHGDVILPPKPAAITRVTELEIKDGWCADDNGHIWSMLEGKPNSLSEWNGEQWVLHEIPPLMQGKGLSAVTTDTKGRIWMLPGVDESPAAYYDTRNAKWSAFANIQNAYKAVKNDPPHFQQDHVNSFAPEYSPDGKRMAFRGRSLQIYYFDGAAWRSWKRGPDFAPGGNNIGAPFFSAAGELGTIIEGDAWQWDGKSGWHQLTAQPSPAPAVSTRKPPINPPEGCVTGSPESIAEDNRGVFWLTWRGKLYKSVPGVCIEVFSKDEANPFTDGRRIQDAWVDQRGNVFFKTGTYTRIMVASKSPPPKASVVVENIATDSTTARLSADPSPGIQFRWQLDNGPWQITKEKTVTLDRLANGSHTIAVAAIDPELQTSPQAVAKFQIKVDPRKQIASLLKQLSDPDYSKRQLAVDAIARQPPAVLPELKAAREKAGSDERWWIDAAIQEVERKGSAPAGPAE